METFHLQDGATIDYDPNFISVDQADRVWNEVSVLKYVQPEIFMYNKMVKIPRYQTWMADPDIDKQSIQLYQTSQPYNWTPEVKNIKIQLETMYNQHFDYVLLNFYQTGQHYVGYHTDSEHNDGSTISSLSLGGTRRFLLKNIANPKLIKEFQLTHGCLISMRDRTQATWKHSVPKTQKHVNPRINLTFRTINPKLKPSFVA